MQKIFRIFLMLLIACFLVNCSSENSEGIGEGSGGGGGGSGGGGIGDGKEGGSKPSSFVKDCSGTRCGSDGNRYKGSGVGIWRYKNTGNSNVAADVFLSNVANKDITVVFTNEGTDNVTLPSIAVNTALKNEIYLDFNQIDVDTFNYIPDDIRNFKLPKLIEQDNELNLNLTPLYQTWSVDDKHNWSVYSTFSPVSRAATLKQQINVGRRAINIWVEDSEYGSGKIDDAKINEIASSVDNVYTNVVNLIGEPWGIHNALNLMIPIDQPLNIVLVNLKKDNRPLGTMGYFWARDNYLKTAYSSTSDSNEALAMIVDTETYYLKNGAGVDGKHIILSTIAHELTHAVQFYQRHVLMNDKFDTFLNEMSAVMMEDIISSKISFNLIIDRYCKWLKTPLYHQSFAYWKSDDDTASSYNVAGSFGAYLLRQYGIDFYKKLFQTESDSSISENDTHAKSIDILDKAIKQYNGYGLTRALQRWGAGIAMLPAAVSPEGFGYPVRNNDNGFSFEAFNGKDYEQYRELPTSSPSILEPYAHFPFLRRATSEGIYKETFNVPKNVSVTIVVQ